MGHHRQKRFGVTSDKTLVGPGLVQFTTTVDTKPTTTSSTALVAAFIGWSHGSFVGRFGKPLQDVGHHTANGFGVASDKTLVGIGPAQSTTTVDTMPTTTFLTALPAAFTEWTHGSFVEVWEPSSRCWSS